MTENAVEEKGRRRRGSSPAVPAPVDEPDDSSSAITVGKGRATPGRRTQEDEKEEGNIVTRSAGGIRGYFEEVRAELDKVSWPTREEALRLTRVVMIVLVIAAIVMGFINFLFNQFVAFGINNPIVFVVLLAAVVGVAVWIFRGQGASRSY